MKIYTKKGDAGSTSLFGGQQLTKDALRIQAYGTVDELNAVMGLCVSGVEQSKALDKVKEYILPIQKQLFTLGAELATPEPDKKMQQGFLSEEHVSLLEKQMDEWEESLTPLKKFVLPGGTFLAAYLHLARTVCRRAERLVVALSHQESLRPIPIQYLNRLSDWLFVLARYANHLAGQEDVFWEGILK